MGSNRREWRELIGEFDWLIQPNEEHMVADDDLPVVDGRTFNGHPQVPGVKRSSDGQPLMPASVDQLTVYSRSACSKFRIFVPAACCRWSLVAIDRLTLNIEFDRRAVVDVTDGE